MGVGIDNVALNKVKLFDPKTTNPAVSVNVPLILTSFISVILPVPVFVTVNALNVVAPVMVCGEVPLKLIVLVLAVNVPALSKFPAMLVVNELAFNVPLTPMVKLPDIVIPTPMVVVPPFMVKLSNAVGVEGKVAVAPNPKFDVAPPVNVPAVFVMPPFNVKVFAPIDNVPALRLNSPPTVTLPFIVKPPPELFIFKPPYVNALITCADPATYSTVKFVNVFVVITY